MFFEDIGDGHKVGLLHYSTCWVIGITKHDSLGLRRNERTNDIRGETEIVLFVGRNRYWNSPC